MDDFSEPANDIERAIANTSAAPEDDPELKARRGVLSALALNPVTVLTREPWDGEEESGQSTELMYVSDGSNLEQAMLALFTNAERAERFKQMHESFRHPFTVAGPWAIANVAEGAGIMVNPNQALTFRILPELATVLRTDVIAAVERAREHERADNPGA